MLAASRKIYSFPVPATGLGTDERDHWDKGEQEWTRFPLQTIRVALPVSGKGAGEYVKCWLLTSLSCSKWSRGLSLLEQSEYVYNSSEGCGQKWYKTQNLWGFTWTIFEIIYLYSKEKVEKSLEKLLVLWQNIVRLRVSKSTRKGKGLIRCGEAGM